MKTIDILKKVKEGSMTIEDAARDIDEKQLLSEHPSSIFPYFGMMDRFFESDDIGSLYSIYKRNINIGLVRPSVFHIEAELYNNIFIMNNEAKIVIDSDEYRVINFETIPAFFYYAQKFNWTKTKIFNLSSEDVNEIYLIINRKLIITDSPDRMYLICSKTNTFINTLNESSVDNLRKLQSIIGENIVPLSLILSKMYVEVRTNENIFIVKDKNLKYSVINKNGDIITNCLYDNINDFREGVSIVRLDNKKGFIDKNGKLIVDVKYDEIHFYRENKIVAAIENKYCILNMCGEIVIPAIYNYIDTKKYNDIYYFLLIKDGLCGILDFNCNVILETIYKNLQYIKNGFFTFRSNDDNYIGVIDIKGKMILTPEYKNVNINRLNIEASGFKDDKKTKVYRFDFNGELIKE
jgi:hypothetical protein